MLLVLLAGMMGFVLWYVIDRRAKMKAPPPVATQPVAPAPPVATQPVTPQTAGPTPASRPAGPGPAAPTVDLTKTDGQTIDFSSGKPVVKNSAEDKAAMDAALKDMAEATKDTTFTAPKKPAAGTQTTPPKP